VEKRRSAVGKERQQHRRDNGLARPRGERPLPQLLHVSQQCFQLPNGCFAALALGADDPVRELSASDATRLFGGQTVGYDRADEQTQACHIRDRQLPRHREVVEQAAAREEHDRPNEKREVDQIRNAARTLC